MAEATEIRALSGKPVESLTVEEVRAGELGVADLRIHPDTLEHQAVVAAEHGNRQLDENLRRHRRDRAGAAGPCVMAAEPASCLPRRWRRCSASPGRPPTGLSAARASGWTAGSVSRPRTARAVSWTVRRYAVALGLALA